MYFMYVLYVCIYLVNMPLIQLRLSQVQSRHDDDALTNKLFTDIDQVDQRARAFVALIQHYDSFANTIATCDSEGDGDDASATGRP